MPIRMLVRSLLLIAGMLAAAPPATADPIFPRCNIGKPSYCLKYAQLFCLRDNLRKDREAACGAWADACIKCHARIPACFAGPRPLRDSARCRVCDKDWTDCMHAIDRQFWPNRRRKN